MAKDHRTKVEVGDVDKVLDGYLEPFLRGYLLAKRRGTDGDNGALPVPAQGQPPQGGAPLAGQASEAGDDLDL